MNYDFSSLITQLQGIQEWLKKEFSNISTGRATPTLLDSIMVDSYGAKQPVKNVASINTEDARTLRIAPWDKSQIKDIEKAIVESKLPFSIGIDDQGVRLSIPELTEENRQSLVKVIKQKLEDTRIKVRAARNDTEKILEKMKKDGEMGEDDLFRNKETMQKHVDSTNKEIEGLFNKKEIDITSI